MYYFYIDFFDFSNFLCKFNNIVLFLVFKQIIKFLLVACAYVNKI